MIRDLVQRHEFHMYGLGGREPPKEVVEALKKMDKNLVAVWNKDSNRFEIYLEEEGALHWQNSAPVEGDITTGITTWLKKFDISNGRFKSKEDREKEWKQEVINRLKRQQKRKDKEQEDLNYEIGHVSKWCSKLMSGASRHIVVPPIVGIVDGKPLRAARSQNYDRRKITPKKFRKRKVIVHG